MVAKKEPVSDKPKPIDDEFWFKYSKEIVDNAANKRDEVASKLQEGIKWLWIIYTAAATVGIALAKESYPIWTVIIIALPSFFLIVAYWLAAWVHLPERGMFHAEIPEEIKDVHERWIGVKSQRLRAAFIVFVLAALMVSFAIGVASISKQSPEYSFKASSYMTENGEEIIDIFGNLPGEIRVLVTVESASPVEGEIFKNEQTYLVNVSGQLQQSIALDFVADSYDVVIAWKGTDGVTHSLMRTVSSNSDG